MGRRMTSASVRGTVEDCRTRTREGRGDEWAGGRRDLRPAQPKSKRLIRNCMSSCATVGWANRQLAAPGAGSAGLAGWSFASNASLRRGGADEQGGRA